MHRTRPSFLGSQASSLLFFSRTRRPPDMDEQRWNSALLLGKADCQSHLLAMGKLERMAVGIAK